MCAYMANIHEEASCGTRRHDSAGVDCLRQMGHGLENSMGEPLAMIHDDQAMQKQHGKHGAGVWVGRCRCLGYSRLAARFSGHVAWTGTP